MQPTNIIYEIASKPIGELAELPAAELAEMQKEVETLIALADNVRKWLNGALMLKYRDRLDGQKRPRRGAVQYQTHCSQWRQPGRLHGHRLYDFREKVLFAQR